MPRPRPTSPRYQCRHRPERCPGRHSHDVTRRRHARGLVPRQQEEVEDAGQRALDDKGCQSPIRYGKAAPDEGCPLSPSGMFIAGKEGWDAGGEGC